MQSVILYWEMVLGGLGGCWMRLEKALAGEGPGWRWPWLKMVLVGGGPSWRWPWLEVALAGGGPGWRWLGVSAGGKNLLSTYDLMQGRQ